MRYKTVFIAFGRRDINCVSLMSPDISNLHTFVGVETDYIAHYVDIVGFNSKKFITQDIAESDTVI